MIWFSANNMLFGNAFNYKISYQYKLSYLAKGMAENRIIALQVFIKKVNKIKYIYLIENRVKQVYHFPKLIFKVTVKICIYI